MKEHFSQREPDRRHLPSRHATSRHTTGRQSGVMAMLSGAFAASMAAIGTGLLLLVNGSIALLFFRLLNDSGSDWVQNKGVLQFGLFTLPLILLVGQWMVWDFFRGRFERPTQEED